MIVLGCRYVAQAILSRGTLGGVLTENVGVAMAVVMAIYVTGVSLVANQPCCVFCNASLWTDEMIQISFLCGSPTPGSLRRVHNPLWYLL